MPSDAPIQTTDDTGYAPSERRRVLLSASIAGFAVPFLTTMLNLSLADIGDTFSVGSHELGYINTALLLSSAIAVVPVSRIADIRGKRRTFLTGMCTMSAGLAIAFLSPSFPWLIAGRAIMGIGAAAMLSTGVSLITDVYPSEVRGAALGYHSMGLFVGTAGGPPIGGILNDLIGWRALFMVPIPFLLIAVASMASFRHEIAPGKEGRMDVSGSAMYAVGLLLLMTGMMRVTECWGPLAIIIGTAVLTSFARYESDIRGPVLDVGLFRSRVFTGSCISAFMLYAASFSVSYFMSLYLQSIGAMSSSEAGLLMMIQALMQTATSEGYGRLSDRIRDKRLLPAVGSAVVSAGVSLFLFYDTGMSMTLVIVTLALIGMGMGMFAAPNTSEIMGSVPKEKTGEASGMVTVMRQTGATTSMSVAMLAISLTMGSSNGISPENYGTFVDAMHLAFGICLCMCLVSVATSMLKGRSLMDKSPDRSE